MHLFGTWNGMPFQFAMRMIAAASDVGFAVVKEQRKFHFAGREPVLHGNSRTRRCQVMRYREKNRRGLRGRHAQGNYLFHVLLHGVLTSTRVPGADDSMH